MIREEEFLHSNFLVSKIEAINFISLSESYVAYVLSMRNSRQIRSWMFNDTVITSKSHAYFINNLKEDTKNGYWMVRKETNIVGCIYLNKIDVFRRSAYVGMYANPFSKERGNGGLLMSMLLHIVFQVAGFYVIKLEVKASNHHAIRFYEHNGFIEEKKRTDLLCGDEKDVVVMKIVR